MMVIEMVFVILTILILIPTAVLLVQTVAAFAKRHDNIQPTGEITASVCILMPAHNEAGGIAQVLRILLPQLTPDTRVLIVADNCSDDTARIAREVGTNRTGFEVVERTDANRRGKGYALDFGVRHLAKMPPRVVVILDSDCELRPGSFETMVQACLITGRPTQALYLMHTLPGAGIKARLAEFAWLVKNQVRPLGYHRLGLPCQLMGTGMVFLWDQISKAKLGSGHIVEDMKLGVDLTQAGTPPLFCPDALVTSYFPSSQEGLQAQRTRWEHGHLGVILAETPKLFMQAVLSGNLSAFALALDLCVPPLALLTLLIIGLFLVNAAFFWVGGALLPVVMTIATGAMLGLAVALSWAGFGRAVISLKQLAWVPVYIFAKIPLYFYFLLKRQVEWVRSRRDGE